MQRNPARLWFPRPLTLDIPEPREMYAKPSGGSKPWTGRGPKLARHIPWLQIFKHHISAVEGHYHMLNMIMKHTVPGTESYKTIRQMVDRASEMLHMSKIASRSFVSPTGQREQVPLGPDSVSVHPGYSSSDYIYGSIGKEYDTIETQSRAQGTSFEPPEDASQYGIGQAINVKTQTLTGMRAAKIARGKDIGSGSSSGTDAQAAKTTKAKETTNGDVGPAKQFMEEVNWNEEAKPLYVVDVKPTHFNIPGMPPPAALKRTSEGEVSPQQSEAKKFKKLKTKHDGNMPKATAINKVELEDISEEVDARLREKEERQNRKEEKKRKRKTEGQDVVAADPVEPDDDAAYKPKTKKKKMKAKDSSQTTIETPSSLLAEKKSSKKRKLEAHGEAPAETLPKSEEVEKPKKKTKKSEDGAAGDKMISRKRNGSGEEEAERKKRKTARDDVKEA